MKKILASFRNLSILIQTAILRKDNTMEKSHLKSPEWWTSVTLNLLTNPAFCLLAIILFPHEKSYAEARKKYSSFLSMAYHETKRLNINNIPKVFDLRHIDMVALDVWEKTWKPHYKSDSHSGWDWRGLVRKYKKDTAKYVDLAIWSNSQLCGLAIGKLSKSNSHCSIYYVEGCPIVHPLKRCILPLTIDFAENMALLVGGNSIRFVNPDEKLFDYYAEFGFKLELHRKTRVRLKRGDTPCRNDGESYFMRDLYQG